MVSGQPLRLGPGTITWIPYVSKNTQGGRMGFGGRLQGGGEGGLDVR
jgi:hypothetical protein